MCGEGGRDKWPGAVMRFTTGGSMEPPRVTVRSEADGLYVVVCSGEFDLDTCGVHADVCDG